MNGIILGAGRIGYNLAKSMVDTHDIILIDKDKDTCNRVNDLLECYVIHGTGTNTRILEEADINKADFFVATTSNDEVNLLSSVYAKENGVEIIVARLNDIDHTEIFRKLGIRFVNPETSAMRYIARNIVRPTAQSLVSIGKGNAEIMELKVKNSDILFMPIKEIENNTNKFIIVTIYINDEAIIPTPDTELGYDDSIAVLVKSEYLEEVRQYFTVDNANMNDIEGIDDISNIDEIEDIDDVDDIDDMDDMEINEYNNF